MDPYVFSISDSEVVRRPRYGHHHDVLASKLLEAGYKVGLMLWTTDPSVFTEKRVRELWHEAFLQAGIKRMDSARDEEKGRTWYKVWPRPEEAKPIFVREPAAPST